MRFEFAAPARIVVGPGTVQEVAPAAGSLGNRGLVVSGAPAELAGRLVEALEKAGIETATFDVTGEPTTESVLAGVARAREAECDLVIELGGGSALDHGKAIAALLTNGGEPLDYLEVIGRGQPIRKPAAPHIAIPTTAGTGAEVTKNAVLLSPEHGVKVSLRSPYLLPDLAVVDPELTHTLPPAITASTGLDALTQLIEPFVSNKANPLTDAICREGMNRAGRSLRRAYQDGADAEAREDMALASLFGGLALANAKLGAVHGFAGPVGGMFHAPHGVVCARLLPHVMETNVSALQAREPTNPALARYDEAARILSGEPDATAADGVAWVQELSADLGIPPLSDFGISEAAFPAVIAATQKASSTKGNPIALTDGDLAAILRRAL